MSRGFVTKHSNYNISKLICNGCLAYFQEQKLIDAHKNYDCILIFIKFN